MGAGSGMALVGRRVGGCEILRPLGEGGMGTVYLCRQLSLERSVVAKILHPEFCRREEFVKRFHREAKAAGQLFHPNIVQVLDHGLDGDLYYIIMEYVEGVTVRDMIDSRGSIPMDQAIRIASDSAKGLGAAHESGIVHRDVKPANIMLNSHGVAKIADFGIAKPMGGDADEITQTNYLVGTVQYMSPEQCEGRDVDGRADIYSLGITFYQMLTGRRPFEGKSTVDLMRQHLHEAPPPLETYVQGVPRELSSVLARMLAKDKGDRYPDCAALLEDLAQFEERRQREGLLPTQKMKTAREVGRGVLTGRPRRRGWLVPLVVLALFVGVAGSYAYVKLGGSLPAWALDLWASLRARLGGSGGDGPENPGTAGLDKRAFVKKVEREIGLGACGTALALLSEGMDRWGSDADLAALFVRIEDAIRASMVRVDAGPAVIGDESDPLSSPRHEIELPEFYIDRYAVSCSDYARYVRATKAPAPPSWADLRPPQGREDHPVTEVTFEEAAAYARWCGKRLPTELEWEKAARGSAGRTWPWGNEFVRAKANTHHSGRRDTIPVGDLPISRSPYGAEQLIGNVWEWTSSSFAPYSGSMAAAEAFQPEERVVRGGSYKYFDRVATDRTPTAFTRLGVAPGDQRRTDLGFRCVWQPGAASRDR